ncbi:hypothetical protein BJX63DRAFT_438723 [Aspergillus granulosus]|uniref:Uncharacterized protein n=1 Tax=Aspergillus granulosus TaxID=176169 RepID=A0ABR4GR47_9EURO
MRTYILRLIILFGMTAMVQGADEPSVVFDSSTGNMVLNVPTFEATWNHSSKEILQRRSDLNPTCSLDYGLARVEETIANIEYLSDVYNITCNVPAASCARVAHEGVSSIFFCSFEDHPVSTKCGDLVNPATQVFQTCQLGDQYAYGYISQMIHQERESYPYILVIGDDFMFDH